MGSNMNCFQGSITLCRRGAITLGFSILNERAVYKLEGNIRQGVDGFAFEGIDGASVFLDVLESCVYRNFRLGNVSVRAA